MPYENNINPYWNVIITFSTVGYGDFAPKTHFGRFFSCVSMFFGQFAISLILIAMSISAQFTLEEAKAFKDMKIMEYYIERIDLGGKILKTFFLMDLSNKFYLREKDGLENHLEEERDETEQEKNVQQSDAKSMSHLAVERGIQENRDQLSENENPQSSNRNIQRKVFKFDRYSKIGNLKASRMLKIKLIKLVNDFKELNAYSIYNEDLLSPTKHRKI